MGPRRDPDQRRRARHGAHPKKPEEQPEPAARHPRGARRGSARAARSRRRHRRRRRLPAVRSRRLDHRSGALGRRRRDGAARLSSARTTFRSSCTTTSCARGSSAGRPERGALRRRVVGGSGRPGRRRWPRVCATRASRSSSCHPPARAELAAQLIACRPAAAGRLGAVAGRPPRPRRRCWTTTRPGWDAVAAQPIRDAIACVQAAADTFEDGGAIVTVLPTLSSRGLGRAYRLEHRGRGRCARW